MTYQYSYVEFEGSSQYDENDYINGGIVEAKYIPAILECDRGNPFIEALPRPREAKEIEIVYNTVLGSYDYEKVKSMTKLEKMMSVKKLKDLRFNLPFHETMEFEFFCVMTSSYSARKQLQALNKTVEYIAENEEKESTAILIGDSASSTNAGFSLIGYSGCGKSSAIEILTAHYPQVIMHKMGEYESFPQITYLVVNCVANSNFSALYEGIGDAIDKALGNVEPVYALEINRARNLGAKANLVARFLEIFAVGVIVFDEIQLIDFEHTKENTFDSLLTLTNKTKTGIVVVGTEDARGKMFKELRTSRRLGKMISADMYCENKSFFKYLWMRIIMYQWFDERLEYTEELCDTLYDLTKGIIEQLVSLYIAVQIEYLSTQEHPKVNSNYFKKVAEKYFSGIQNVLANLESTNNVKELEKIRKSADYMIELVVEKERQNATAKSLAEHSEDRSDEENQLYNIIAMITTLYDEYTEIQIQNAYKNIISKSANQNLPDKRIAQKVLAELEKKPKIRKSEKKNKINVNLEDYKTFLEEDDED